MWKQTITGTGNHHYLITTGVHGNETGSVLCGIKLAELLKDTDNHKIFASVTILHAVNETGIVKCERNYQNISTNDLNRALSLTTYKTQGQIESILKDEIFMADIVIDIHNSPIVSPCFVLNIDDKTNSYAKFFDNNRLQYYAIYSSTNTIKKYASELGKVAFTYEEEGMSGDYYDYSGKLTTLINRLNSIEDLNIFNTLSKPVIKPIFEFKAGKAGIFEFLLIDSYLDNRFNKVKSGDIIGRITDIQTGLQEDVFYYGEDGYVLVCEHNKYVSEDTTLLYVNINSKLTESELARQNSESIDFSKASVICKVLPICKNTGKIFLESLDNGESYGCFLSEAESLGNNLLSDELRSIVNRKFHIFDDPFIYEHKVEGGNCIIRFFALFVDGDEFMAKIHPSVNCKKVTYSRVIDLINSDYSGVLGVFKIHSDTMLLFKNNIFDETKKKIDEIVKNKEELIVKMANINEVRKDLESLTLLKSYKEYKIKYGTSEHPMLIIENLCEKYNIISCIDDNKRKHTPDTKITNNKFTIEQRNSICERIDDYFDFRNKQIIKYLCQ